MARSSIFAFTLVASFAAGPALASTTTLTATGHITSISALQNSQPEAAPAGRFGIGDAYKLTTTFDLSQAELTSLYDADPTVNIYYLPGTTVSFSAGSYSLQFAPLFDMNSSVQLWNNRDVVGPTDSQSFSSFDYNERPAALPFDLGAGQQSLSLDLNAYDFTALARTNDLISQIAPFAAFASKSFSLGQLNSDNNRFVSVSGSVESAGFAVPAVPEPATWGMMMLGISIVGGVMRRRHKVRTIVQFC